MGLFRLEEFQCIEFASKPEILSGVQVGYIHNDNYWGFCLVVGGAVAAVFDKTLPSELRTFWDKTWNIIRSNKFPAPIKGRFRPSAFPPREDFIVALYKDWMLKLPKVGSLIHVPATSAQISLSMLSTGTPVPPPPPTRPSTLPTLHPATSTVYGHLPFATVTQATETFYRFESWPTSRRIDTKTNSYLPDTYANPESELPFLPTGFAAVARNALPSLFPAVFKWTLKPAPVTVACGAIVPQFGQSGGGVEICFTSGGNDRSIIRRPQIVEPL